MAEYFRKYAIISSITEYIATNLHDRFSEFNGVLFKSPVADGLGFQYLTAGTFKHPVYFPGWRIDQSNTTIFL